MSTTAVIAIVIARRRRPRRRGVLHPGASQRRPWCRRPVGRNGATRQSARRASTAAVPSRDRRRRRPRSRPPVPANRTTSTALATIDHDAQIVPWTPPDPEVIGETRRQFFNRATVDADERRHRHVRRGGLRRDSCGRRAPGGFGGLVGVGKLPANQGRHQAGQRLLLRRRGPLVDHRVPGRGRSPQPSWCTRRSLLVAMRQGIVILSQKCPHLGCRVPRVQDQPVVRVPVPRLAVQPRRREEGRPCAARHGPSPGHDRRRTATSRSTPASGSPAPPSASNTTGQEAEGPHCTGGGEH